MMANLREWWRERSERERMLLGVLGALLGATLLWLAVWRPLAGGQDNGWARLGEAVDRAAAIDTRLAQLRTAPRARGEGAGAPLAQRLTQGAAEAGLTLDRATAQGADGMAVTIASARSGALLGWLGRLEAGGVMVETISIAPAPTAGALSVQAVLREMPR